MDYVRIAEALRAKARDKAVSPEERDALNAKADELAGKCRNASPQPVFIVPHIQYVYRKDDQFVVKTFDFPDDWYVTMDEWWNYESGSLAE